MGGVEFGDCLHSLSNEGVVELNIEKQVSASDQRSKEVEFWTESFLTRPTKAEFSPRTKPLETFHPGRKAGVQSVVGPSPASL
jgi:hypothetical protein